MEIDITSLLETDMFPFSHSQMEGGPSAGPDTWNAALSGPRPLLNTSEELQAFRDYMKGTGFSESDEMDTWPENETQALFLQLIAGDVREAPGILEGVTIAGDNEDGWFYNFDGSPNGGVGMWETRSEAYHAAIGDMRQHDGRLPRADSLSDIDWLEFDAESQAGRISGNMFKCDIPGHVSFGRIFYQLDS